MNKKPPILPNIEDATLRACLAPLVDAMNAGQEAAVPPTQAFVPAGVLSTHTSSPPQPPAGSNDNPVPTAHPGSARVGECCGLPKTLAEWRSLADDEFGAFRMIEHFLGMTDAALESAAADFPKQFSGTLNRMARIKRRLAARYDAVTTVTALLERATARAAARLEVEREEASQLPLTGD